MTNPVGKRLNLIGKIIYIVSAIVGFISLNSLVAAIAFWVVGGVSGTLLIGFAEIIQLLEDIKNK